ncbi:aminopeptidase [Spirochaeta cellobiosiphila]|uniref:aminopeptidase n=1 Tax=Spirochaeta cellobiosiphila TaxID=504483 RepID=UPI00040E1DE3|nr:aminopeptidase [Spirochaeta cellobiosiphila]
MNTFNQWNQFDPDTQKAAEVAITEVLAMRSGESLLIVTNPCQDVMRISEALYDAAIKKQVNPVLIVQPVKSQLDFTDKAVIGALKSEPDVVISMSEGKMGKDKEAMEHPYVVDGKEQKHIYHHLMYGIHKTRSFWSPGITTEIFSKSVPIDYHRLRKEASLVKKVLDSSTFVHITSPLGTDLEMGLKERIAFLDDGNFSLSGKGGNLPAGEAFISPENGTSQGQIAFNGSISAYDGDIVIDTPIICKVEKGFVTDVVGAEEAKRLEKSLQIGAKQAYEWEKEGKVPTGQAEYYAQNARHLGELGIGLNPQAKVIGNMLVDEKAYRTCHIAIGSNYDNDAPALIHLDGIISEPTIVSKLGDGSSVKWMDKGIIDFDLLGSFQ